MDSVNVEFSGFDMIWTCVERDLEENLLWNNMQKLNEDARNISSSINHGKSVHVLDWFFQSKWLFLIGRIVSGVRISRHT